MNERTNAPGEPRQAANDSGVGLDAEGRVVSFDAAAEQAFGCRAEEALGRPLAAIAMAACQREARERALAEARLKDALNEIDSLAYSISHDLRAPLRHLDGFVHLLKEELGEGLGADALHFLEIISESSQQMNALIEGLLALSRAGTAPMHPADLNMSALVDEVVRDAAAGVGSRIVQWDIEALPPAWGDRTLLRRVWSCLIDNALKFTRNKSPAEVAVGAMRRESETVYFVRDNGAGFDMSHAERLFGAFQRLHHAREFEGTGVGLAIVRRIAVRHGGSAWAEGKRGEGATVFFSLPPG